MIDVPNTQRVNPSSNPEKISLFIIPHCFTLSAFAKNFIARATSINPKTTFTSFSHPPDFGIDWIHFGNIANNANGNPNAMPNPAAPAVSGHAPWSATPVNRVPSIGPVHENETMASVSGTISGDFLRHLVPHG